MATKKSKGGVHEALSSFSESTGGYWSRSNSDFEKYKDVLRKDKFDWIVSSECQLDLKKDIRVNQLHRVGSDSYRNDMLLSNVIEMYSKLENIRMETFMKKYNSTENPIERNIYYLISNEKGITSAEVLKSSIQSYKDKILHCGQFDIIHGAT